MKIFFFGAALILAVCILRYCLPLSKNQKISIAKDELQYLFNENNIDTSLFKGPISIKEQNETWFQWVHIEKADSLIIRIWVPRFRMLSNDHYMLGKESLWEKVYESDPRCKKTNENRTSDQEIWVHK